MNRKILIGALVAAAVSFGSGVMVGARHLAADGPTAGKSEPRILFYRNPMNPAVTSATPAKDEMGMDYIPVYEGKGADAADAAMITVTPEVANNLGVRTETATRGEIARRIETVGYVGYDEHRLSHVHLRAEGWIEDLHIHAVGDQVRKGDLLFHFYAPELVNAQEEFLQAIEAHDARLVELSRRRLDVLGIPRSVTRALERSKKVHQRLPIYASQNGVVAELNVREGMFVGREMDVMTLADLESVWLLVDVFETQAAWVRAGQQAEVRLASHPERLWQGRVEYIYPEVDARTRAVRVRLRFANPDTALKPNMYAVASIFADAHPALHVSRDALIRTEHGARVILARDGGRFAPVTVQPGIESADRVEILEGLQEGDRVVVSAQFLIDSEASLRAALRRMTPPAGDGAGEGEPTTARFHSTGVVRAVDGPGRTLNITHEPIPALGWPAMTMDFPVARDVAVDALKPGMRIAFELVQRDAVSYEITSLRVDSGGAK